MTLNQKDDGYRGIWYMNQPSGDEYVYKYSGGLGTYCAKHQPFAVYRPEVDKTFFCYGGTTHETAIDGCCTWSRTTTTRPARCRGRRILLDKQTSDAHDNPVISVDDEGYIWIFSTSHGTSPAVVHPPQQASPTTIDAFELVAGHASRGRPAGADHQLLLHAGLARSRTRASLLLHALRLPGGTNASAS